MYFTSFHPGMFEDATLEKKDEEIIIQVVDIIFTLHSEKFIVFFSNIARLKSREYLVE